MSKKFNPLSTVVALATAGAMVAVAGCAMGTRSADESTAQAPLSRDEGQLPNAQQTAQADTTMSSSSDMSSSTTASGQWTPPASQSMVQNDTSATPYPNAADTQQPAATTSSSSMDYSRNAGTQSSTDMSSSTYDNGDQALPPRSDRN